MAWQYDQKTGSLMKAGHTVGFGYSGKGNGKNNPSMEGIRSVGPIPRGPYKIGRQYKHPTKGPITMPLTPVGHTAHGRIHFLIHGDNIQHPGEASEGCIILNKGLRQAVATSGDTQLEVVL